jgi:hypothetical protein
MNIKDDDRVSAVALVVESEEAQDPAIEETDGQEQLVDASSDGAGSDQSSG